MSYDSDPSLYNFAPAPLACSTCYDVGETPKQVWIGVSGIQKGPLAGGGDPPPPNGVFLITAVSPCIWTGIHNGFTFTMRVAGSPLRLEITHPSVGQLFFDPTTITCRRYWANILTSPLTSKYYGGYATLSNPLSQDGFSIFDFQAEIGLDASPDVAVSVRAGPASASIFGFARTRDNSNLKIRVVGY